MTLPKDDADAPKHVGVLTTYKILLIYIIVARLLVWIIRCVYESNTLKSRNSIVYATRSSKILRRYKEGNEVKKCHENGITILSI